MTTWLELSHQFDESVLVALSHLRSPLLTQGMIDFTALGSFSVLSLLTLIAGLILWRHRMRTAAFRLLLASLGAAFWPKLIKALIARPRPDIVEPLAMVSDSSFPSGHTFGATVMYLTLAYIAFELSHRRVFYVVAGLVIALVAFSRMYLGVHYPTDVLAGLLAGLGWAWACRRWPRPS